MIGADPVNPGSLKDVARNLMCSILENNVRERCDPRATDDSYMCDGYGYRFNGTRWIMEVARRASDALGCWNKGLDL